ncbi:MAG: zinc finger domain-containing protein, partial [bacterium]
EYTYEKFKKLLAKGASKNLKQFLMDQSFISGIGNIYSDEALWYSSINPQERVKNISDKKLKELFKNIKKVLNESLLLGGDSMSDYRNPYGEKGGYQKIHKVYRKAGEKCVRKNCSGIIQRIKVGGRSAHFCNCHQKFTHTPT